MWQRRYTGSTMPLPAYDLNVLGLAALLDGSYLLLGTKPQPFVPGPGFVVR